MILYISFNAIFENFNFLNHIKKKLLQFKNISKNNNKDFYQLLIIGNTAIQNSDIDICADIKKMFVNRAKDYEDASLLISHNKYDLIIIDYQLGHNKSIDTIRNISSNSYRIPIIAIKKPAKEDTMVNILSYGYDDCLTSPVDTKNLEIILRRWLGNQVLRDNKKKTAIHLKKTKIEEAIKKDKYLFSEELTNRYTTNKNSILDSTKRTLDIEASLKYSHYNNELAKDLLVLLIISIKSERHKLISLFKNKNWAEIGELAHKLYGTSCYCGVTLLQQKTKEMETAVNENNIKSIQDIYPELMQAMDDLLIWNETHDIEIIFNLK